MTMVSNAATEVVLAQRKASVLAASILPCLSGLPTVNLSSGCAHRCVYCYARGYSQFPGENKVVVYANTFDKLRSELPRKRKRPLAVYFSPSTDAFQPVRETLELGYQCMEFLLSNNVGVAILTKGRIPNEHMRLFESHPQLVQAQIGVTTLDSDVASAFEPNAAPPQVRLEQIRRLIKAGIRTEARLDPILPGVTDDDSSIHALMCALSESGVHDIAVATLFLRSTIVGSLRRHLSAQAHYLNKLMKHYESTKCLPLYADKGLTAALPLQAREEIYARVARHAHERGMAVHICACKNRDMQGERCNIAGRWPECDGESQLFARVAT